MELNFHVLELKENTKRMKERTAGLRRQVSFIVEIIFALLLVFNGVILLLNLLGLFTFQQEFPGFAKIGSILSLSAHEWRFLIESIYAMVVSHLAAVVMICLGIVIAGAAIHTKKSL